MKRYLSYNDVSILPKYSEINFKDVNLKTRLTKSLFIDTPIITRLDDVLLDCLDLLSTAPNIKATFFHIINSN